MRLLEVTGHWENTEDEMTVTVHPGSWNGKYDMADEFIFFYMDGEPLKVGDTIAGNFVVTEID